MITYASLKKPPLRIYRSFQNWVWDRKPLTREESSYIKYADDLIALSDGQEGGSFDGVVDDALGWLPRSLADVGLRPLYPAFSSWNSLTSEFSQFFQQPNNVRKLMTNMSICMINAELTS